MCSFIQPVAVECLHVSGPVLGTYIQLWGLRSRGQSMGNDEHEGIEIGSRICTNPSEKQITPKPLTEEVEE